MAENTKDDLLSKLEAWKTESDNQKSAYVTRWAKNMELFKGRFNEDEVTKSRVRNRSKIFYRKIWATIWRLVASFYNAFLRDPDSFKIDGRGPEDTHKAKILHNITVYRRDYMMRTQSLFRKFLWAFFDIGTFGWSIGKMTWEYDIETGKDGPEFVLYPIDQVFPDMSAETKEQMRYIIFENYLTRDDLEEKGYDNIEQAEPEGVPNNPFRSSRYTGTKDPLQNPGENEYPRPGAYVDERKDTLSGRRYRVWEVFYKEKGRIKFCITNGSAVYFKKPVDSPYGDHYPIIMGECLTEPHKLIGEGFPEPLEGPQESYNANLNMRKDNVAISLNRGAVVSRRAGVDLQSLVVSRPGRITLADDVDAIKWDEIPDVTQSAYLEAAADEGMMEEMSGVTAIKSGKESTDKATVAQINYSESNAKIDLYIAIVGETFIKDFYYELARQIQMFETDETVFRIANDNFRKETKSPFIEDVYDLDFDADCVVNVGMGTVGRDIEIRQTFLAMDRAVMSNQSMIQLLSTGVIPPEGIRLFDMTKFMEVVLPKLGYKNVNEFFISVPSPQMGGMGMSGGGQNSAIAGRTQPQIGNMDVGNQANDLQKGSFGGI